MAQAPVPEAPRSNPDPAVLGCAVLIVVLLALAYARTFAVPTLLDDTDAVTDNPTIRHLGSSLHPPGNSTVGGRPFLNLTLAVDYAVGGPAVWIYHLTNLAIHACASLVLFGLVRRTLAGSGFYPATPAALSAALLWALHPLQTESVTYIVQRAESLMGLLYLLTLYGLVRVAGTVGAVRTAWYALGAAACALGMATKEVMATAPLIALLYDRTFLAGSFSLALRARRWFYALLAASWALLLALVLSNHGRGGTAGFGAGVAWWRYALTQVQAVAHYLRLALWPHPLVFDYGTALAPPSPALVLPGLVLAALAAGTAWALVRRPWLGFLGAGFFAILAPSSSIVPVVTETVAEHRMYLPLAPLAVLATLLLFRGLGRSAPLAAAALAAALLWATAARNETYRSEEALLADTVAHCPDNKRAHNNLGNALDAEGRSADAVREFEAALSLDPGFAEAHSNLGNALTKLPGRMDDAIAQYMEAIRLRPDYAAAQNNLASALNSEGRTSEALEHYEAALRLRPDWPSVHINLAMVMLRIGGRTDEARAHLLSALQLQPGNPVARGLLDQLNGGVR